MFLGVVLFTAFPSQAAQSTSPGISEKELQAFAKVYTDVQRIRLEYEPSLQKTKDPKQIQRIHQEADARIKETLDRQGLTVERYNQIYAAVNNNEELRRKTLKRVEQERKKP
jgi:hypothetical protein